MAIDWATAAVSIVGGGGLAAAFSYLVAPRAERERLRLEREALARESSGPERDRRLAALGRAEAVASEVMTTLVEERPLRESLALGRQRHRHGVAEWTALAGTLDGEFLNIFGIMLKAFEYWLQYAERVLDAGSTDFRGQQTSDVVATVLTVQTLVANRYKGMPS
ncbi:hypothetical protein [Nocardioides immobilis]|nr:hypothetical protein [Nocardioides immobilis]